MVEPLGLALFAFLAAGPPGALPAEVDGWRAEEPAARYDAGTIFDYIDGHGEVYLAYGMKACHARRYAGPAGEAGLLLDVFEMGSAADAYGVFTNGREGEPVALGEEGTAGSGTVAFWKGSATVAITAERPTPRARAAALALAKAVAAALPGGGSRPALVEQLPSEGLDPRSVVYLRHPTLLAAHLLLEPPNVVGVGPDAPAVLGRYRRGGEAWLLVVSHPTPSAAETARDAFARAYLEKGAPTRRADGVHAMAPLDEKATAFVVRAATVELARSLLSARGGTP